MRERGKQEVRALLIEALHVASVFFILRAHHSADLST